MSQAGSSQYIHYKIIQCKVRYNVVRSIASNMAESKKKEFFGSGRSSWNSLKVIRNMNLDGVVIGGRRGNQIIVFASPPTEDAVIATEPLTKEDLVGYLASGCKPKEKWRSNF